MADEKDDKAKEAKEAKAKKAAGKRRGRDEVKKAGFEATIEEGLETKPARLKLRFRKDGVPALMKEFGYKNPNQVPRLEKIVVNMGLGEALANNKILESAVDQLGAITGQKPVVTRARKSIANFKLREGQAIGAAVTLRSDRMYEFMDRLINVALRGCATSRASPARPSTARATTRSACASRLFSRKSTTTKSRR